MHRLLGEYATTLLVETLTDTRNSGIPNDIAALKGKRYVLLSEFAENQHMNEAKLKSLTGGDVVTARFLHGEFFEFLPTHHMIMMTNHKPVIKGIDAWHLAAHHAHSV